MNGLEAICRRNEHNLGQIERRAQKVIREFVILGWIEHLKQRSAWITPGILPHLIDLIEQKYWIIGLDLLEGGDDDAGHGADVCAAMSADFGLVTHAAQGDSVEFAVECLSY